jgi:hypothetical protein
MNSIMGNIGRKIKSLASNIETSEKSTNSKSGKSAKQATTHNHSSRNSSTTAEHLANTPTKANTICQALTNLDRIRNEPTLSELILDTHPDVSSNSPDPSSEATKKAEQIAQSAIGPFRNTMDTYHKALDKQQAANRVEQEKKDKEEKDLAKVNETVNTIESRIDSGNAVEGATELRVRLSELPPELRAQALTKLNERGALERLAVKVTDLNKQDTATAVKELSNTANLVGPQNSKILTNAIANVMSRGGMEQRGASADGAGGLFQGANTHNSEREFIDGIKALGDSPEAELFRCSLTSSLVDIANKSQGVQADRASAMAGAVATGNSQLIPDNGIWTKARELVQSVSKTVADKVNHFAEIVSDWADKSIESATDISKMIAELEPGDTLSISASGKASLRYEISGEKGITITKNEDGTYTVRGSSEVAVGLGLKGTKGGKGNVEGKGDKNSDKSNDLSAAIGANGVAEFKFDNLADAQQGAKTLLKTVAGMPPLTPEESKLLVNNLSAVEIGINGKLKAKLSDVMDANVGEVQSARLEFENGHISAISVSHSLSGSISSNAEFQKKIGLPVGVNGEIKGTVSLRYDLSETVEGDLFDQINAITQDPKKYLSGEPTVSATLTLKGGAKAEGSNESGMSGEVSAGTEVTLSLKNINIAKLNTFAERISQGDIEGAIAATGETASVSVKDYVDTKIGISYNLAVVEFKASEVYHDITNTDVYTIKPSEDGRHLEYEKKSN